MLVSRKLDFRLLPAYCSCLLPTDLLDLSEYRHYFREGFRRGYEDGYHSRSQYGRYSNGTAGILGTILEAILNLQLVN